MGGCWMSISLLAMVVILDVKAFGNVGNVPGPSEAVPLPFICGTHEEPGYGSINAVIQKHRLFVLPSCFESRSTIKKA